MLRCQATSHLVTRGPTCCSHVDIRPNMPGRMFTTCLKLARHVASVLFLSTLPDLGISFPSATLPDRAQCTLIAPPVLLHNISRAPGLRRTPARAQIHQVGTRFQDLALCQPHPSWFDDELFDVAPWSLVYQHKHCIGNLIRGEERISAHRPCLPPPSRLVLPPGGRYPTR